MDPARRRRDTRPRMPARRAFRRKPIAQARDRFAYDPSGRPLQQPPTPTLGLLCLHFTDRRAFRRWQHACIAWQDWHAGDRRNALGLTPRMILPMVVTGALLAVLH